VSVLAAAADTGVQIGTGETVVFWVLGPIALAGALGMVLSKNAVHSALWLVNTMLALGVFYVVQEAPFLGAVQIIVYTGAIMILFLFVLMLVGRDTSDSVVETLRGQRIAAIVLGIGFAGLVGAGIAEATRDTPVTGLEAVQGGAGGAADGNVPAIAGLLFTRYLLAFEVTSALLITAAVGAMVLAHVERDPGSRQSQKELSRARFLSGEHPQTLPGPGVYARGNSIAAPGRLPDGSASPASFSTGVQPQVIDELPPAGSTGAEREGLGHAGGTDAALGTIGGRTTGATPGSGEAAPR
jgi:NADH-quinone oxidoreductase subunit J